MDQLFGVSVAQGSMKYSPVQREQERNVYIPTPFVSDDVCYEDIVSESGPNQSQTNEVWEQRWDKDTPITIPSPSLTVPSQSGSKRRLENDVVVNSCKSAKKEKGKKVGGASLLMDKFESLVDLISQRNVKDMESMNLESQGRGDCSNSLADSLALLLRLPGLVPSSPEFCFACTMIEDPQKSTILSGILTDEARLSWIKYLFEKEK